MACVEDVLKAGIEGHFWRLVVSEFGKVYTVDLLAEDNDQPGRQSSSEWAEGELQLLVSLKEKGATCEDLSFSLGRDYRVINAKWKKRKEWLHLLPLPPAPESGERPSEPPQNPGTRPSLRKIMEAVCEVCGVGSKSLSGPSRVADVCEARQIYYWIARRYTKASFTRIAGTISRDHSTVVHGAQKVDSEFPRFRERIEECLANLGLALDGAGEREAA